MSRLSRAARCWLTLVPLALALGCRGCREAEVEQGMTLTEAADEATFASVEKLGPHRCLSSITRTDRRDGVAGPSHVEVAEIAWRSWDRFRLTRVMDGQPVSDAIVAAGKPYARTYQGPWEAREDAETFRVQLQSTWDSWDTAMEPFGDRVVFNEVGRELIEGRWARKFEVSLGPDPQDPAATAAADEAAPPKKKKKKKKAAHRASFTPVSLSGAVWVDEQSAVRLLASVEGQVQQGNLVRSVVLKLTRSDFGADLDIDPPPKSVLAKPEPLAAPPDRDAATEQVQKKKPRGRGRPP